MAVQGCGQTDEVGQHSPALILEKKRKLPKARNRSPPFAWNVQYSDILAGRASHIYNAERTGESISPIVYALQWPLRDRQLGQTVRNLRFTLELVPQYLLNLERLYQRKNQNDFEDTSIGTHVPGDSFLTQLHPLMVYHIQNIVFGLIEYERDITRVRFHDSTPSWQDEDRRRLFGVLYLASAYTMTILQYVDAVRATIAPDMPPCPRYTWRNMHDARATAGILNDTYKEMFPHLGFLLLFLPTGTEVGRKLHSGEHLLVHPCCCFPHYEALEVSVVDALFHCIYPEEFEWSQPLESTPSPDQPVSDLRTGLDQELRLITSEWDQEASDPVGDEWFQPSRSASISEQLGSVSMGVLFHIKHSGATNQEALDPAEDDAIAAA